MVEVIAEEGAGDFIHRLVGGPKVRDLPFAKHVPLPLYGRFETDACLVLLGASLHFPDQQDPKRIETRNQSGEALF